MQPLPRSAPILEREKPYPCRTCGRELARSRCTFRLVKGEPAIEGWFCPECIDEVLEENRDLIDRASGLAEESGSDGRAVRRGLIVTLCFLVFYLGFAFYDCVVSM